ncbi:MAG: protein kinase domain-containing protein [Dokdonella sp.]
MKQIGEGGNSVVLTDGQWAYKRLKPAVSRDGTARFRREASLLMALRNRADLNVAPAREIREVEGKLEIVMDLFSGNVEKILERYRGQPRQAATALEPIVRTLAELARLPQAIHHRDIKPSNLLYRGNETALWLADFGCAFIAGDERLTPDRRAMGAWAYRPPEYSNGRVEAVDEKGDVFSLGKVLWALIYGEKGIVFPGPVWFTPEYDLGRAFPGVVGIQHAMLVISQACAIDPVRRPTLDQLGESLRQLARAEAAPDAETRVDMLRAQSLVETEHAQRRAATTAFVLALHSDLHAAIAALHAREPEFAFWTQWRTEAVRTHQTADALMLQVAEHLSDAHVVNTRFRGRYLTTRFHPPTATRPASFRASIGRDDDSVHESTLSVTNGPAGTDFAACNADPLPPQGPYSPGVLQRFLDIATQRIYQMD